MAPVTATDYARAERMLAHHRLPLLPGAEVHPEWHPGGDRFHYRRGDRYVLVDPDAGTRTEHDEPPEHAAAGPDRAGAAPGELPSPDGAWTAFRRGPDVWVRATDGAAGGGAEFALTTDGADHHAYGVETDLGRVLLGPRYDPRQDPWHDPSDALPLLAVWSPDSTRLLTTRTDERDVREAVLVESRPAGGGPPVEHRHRYPLPEDEVQPTGRFVVLDVRTRTATWEDAAPWYQSPGATVTTGRVWWDAAGTAAYVLRQSRDARTLALLRLDPATGRTEVVVEETGATRVEPNPFLLDRPLVRVLGTGEVLWYSQRDGRGHLYRYAADGTPLGRVTAGEWGVRALVHVDETAGLVWFLASGLVPGDPYLRQLCRVGLDGTGFTRLTDDDLDHTVVAAPSGRYLVDTASTVSTPPVTVVLDTEGRTVVELERTGTDALEAAGWTRPERFQVKAADGVTDLWGVLWPPYGLDPTRRYPVLDNPYPGPQTQRAPTGFGAFALGQPEALAALGFAVVAVDGRGTPGRNKAFHDASYGDAGLPWHVDDHVAALRQLAERRPWLDLDRVGVHGTSGGGFAAAYAMFRRPDVYRAGVSISGNHDWRTLWALWADQYLGTTTRWAGVDNAEVAANLRGRLLLVHGELDGNVLPAQTLRVVDALIAADKDFDLVVVPGAGHVGAMLHPYVVRRLWDHFVRHLMDTEPPAYTLQPFPAAG